jgi:hypothetical protein
MTDNTNDNGVREFVRVNGVDIDLADVSHDLRMQYRRVSEKAGKRAQAQAELQAVGEAMLAEAFPQMAMKAAIRSGRVTGHNAIARLMGFKK